MIDFFIRLFLSVAMFIIAIAVDLNVDIIKKYKNPFLKGSCLEVDKKEYLKCKKENIVLTTLFFILLVVIIVISL